MSVGPTHIHALGYFGCHKTHRVLERTAWQNDATRGELIQYQFQSWDSFSLSIRSQQYYIQLIIALLTLQGNLFKFLYFDPIRMQLYAFIFARYSFIFHIGWILCEEFNYFLPINFAKMSEIVCMEATVTLAHCLQTCSLYSIV